MRVLVSTRLSGVFFLVGHCAEKITRKVDDDDDDD